MYLVAQLIKHCSDAEHLILYCDTLTNANEVARDIANETGETAHILMVVATVDSNDQAIDYAAA